MGRKLSRVVSWLFFMFVASASPAIAQDTGEPAFKKEEIEQLVAPIALYPDSLIAQILMASTYPLEVVEAARWVKANPNVKDKALEDAMEKQSWDREREVADGVSAGARHDERKARHDPEAGRRVPRASRRKCWPRSSGCARKRRPPAI